MTSYISAAVRLRAIATIAFAVLGFMTFSQTDYVNTAI